MPRSLRLVLLVAANLALAWALVANRADPDGIAWLPNALAAALLVAVVLAYGLFRRD